jgi:hypothetical protein
MTRQSAVYSLHSTVYVHLVCCEHTVEHKINVVATVECCNSRATCCVVLLCLTDGRDRFCTGTRPRGAEMHLLAHTCIAYISVSPRTWILSVLASTSWPRRKMSRSPSGRRYQTWCRLRARTASCSDHTCRIHTMPLGCPCYDRGASASILSHAS